MDIIKSTRAGNASYHAPSRLTEPGLLIIQ